MSRGGTEACRLAPLILSRRMRLGRRMRLDADAPQTAGAPEAATAQHAAAASDTSNDTPAAEHFTVSRRRGAEPSPVQVAQDHASLLRDAYEFFSQRSEDEPLLSPAAEWLLDNFYMVQEALRQIREDLPDQYYSELPKLDEGRSKTILVSMRLCGRLSRTGRAS